MELKDGPQSAFSPSQSRSVGLFFFPPQTVACDFSSSSSSLRPLSALSCNSADNMTVCFEVNVNVPPTEAANLPSFEGR